MSYNVFFSYSHQDLHWIEWLAQSLQSIGIDTYLYKYDPQPGRYHSEKVKKQIELCGCFIVLISQNSQYSQYVQQEIGVAEGMNKLVVPLVEIGIDSKKLALLEGREYAPFDKSNPYYTQPQLIKFLTKNRTSKDLQDKIGLGILAALIIIAIVSRD